MSTFIAELRELKKKTKHLVQDFENKFSDYLAEFEDIDRHAKTGSDSTVKSELLTVQDLSKLLRVHDNTVRRFVALGKIKAKRIGKKLYFLRDELPAMFIENEGEN